LSPPAFFPAPACRVILHAFPVPDPLRVVIVFMRLFGGCPPRFFASSGSAFQDGIAPRSFVRLAVIPIRDHLSGIVVSSVPTSTSTPFLSLSPSVYLRNLALIRGRDFATSRSPSQSTVSSFLFVRCDAIILLFLLETPTLRPSSLSGFFAFFSHSEFYERYEVFFCVLRVFPSCLFTLKSIFSVLLFVRSIP